MAQWITNLLLFGALLAAIWYAWETRRMRLQMIRPKLVFLTRDHNPGVFGLQTPDLFIRNVGEGTAINVSLDRVIDQGFEIQPEPNRIAVLEKGSEVKLAIRPTAKEWNGHDMTCILADSSISPRLQARYFDVESREFRTSTTVGGGATPPFIKDEGALRRWIMRYRKLPFVVGLVVLCTSAGYAKDDPRLMTDAEYTVYLNRLEKELPRWEKEFRRIDAEKISDISYSSGKRVMDDRNVSLMVIRDLRAAVNQERVSRKVSREFGMLVNLSSLYEGVFSLGEILEGTGTQAVEIKSWLWDTIPLFKEIGDYRIRLSNHVLATLERLEARPCE